MAVNSAIRWRYDTIPNRVGKDPSLFPARGVVGEIKPHSTSGIAAGVAQLRRRLAETQLKGMHPTFQLVTYRQVPTDPTRYDLLLANPRQLGTVIRSGRGAVTSWLLIGQVVMRDAITPIPLWQCPTRLGNRIEPKVRAMYQGWMRNVQGHRSLTLLNRSASKQGADFMHEEVDFLRELLSDLGQHSQRS
jgi:hypothetical protein